MANCILAHSVRAEKFSVRTGNLFISRSSASLSLVFGFIATSGWCVSCKSFFYAVDALVLWAGAKIPQF